MKLENICKSFGENHVLQNINWCIAAGEQWQITGVSGCGKTTLLRILMGLEQADSGNIQKSGEIRVSAVFQENRLCSWLNAVDNVRLVCSSAVTDAAAKQELAVLLPEESWHLPARALSGGMQRRVAIARAMLAESDSVLLDEPFAGLDQGWIDRASLFIKERARGRALVLVSHEGHSLPGETKILSLDK